MDLIPDEVRADAAAHLVEAIGRAGGHLGTGFVGVGYLLPVLSSNGYSDVAYRLLEAALLPILAVCHRPRCDDHLGTLGRLDRRERLPVARDELVQPLLPRLGGGVVVPLRPWDRPRSGRRRFRPVGDQAPSRRLAHLCPRVVPLGAGEISTAWCRDGDRFTLDVDIPANVRASVRVPSANPLDVVGAGGGPMSVGGYPGAIGQMEAVFEVGSGSYSFSGPTLGTGEIGLVG